MTERLDFREETSKLIDEEVHLNGSNRCPASDLTPVGLRRRSPGAFWRTAFGFLPLDLVLVI
jgi:hypothetical protein